MKNKLGVLGVFVLLAFVVLSIGVYACISDMDCEGRASGWFSYGSKQVARYGCSDGNCVVVEIRNVKCAKDTDCGNGEVCQVLGDIQNWECVNTKGESFGVTEQAIAQTNSNDFTPYLIIGGAILIGFIILAIIIAVILRRRK